VKLERLMLDINVKVREALTHLVEPMLSDDAPRADDIRI
jgi:hypothetical protein